MFDIGYEVYDTQRGEFADVVDVDGRYVKIDIGGDEYWIDETRLMFADTAYYMLFGDEFDEEEFLFDDDYGFDYLEAGY